MNQENLRSKFYSAINATPFSEKGREHLAKLGTFDLSRNGITNIRKNFHDEIYVHPSLSGQHDGKTEEYNDEEVIVFGKKDENYSIRQRHKELFENNIMNGDSSLFVLTGTAGSGKTTYLNWYFDNILNKAQNKKLILIDIENTQEVRDNVYFCNYVYDLSEKFQNLSGRFVSAIIFQIDKMLRKHTSEKEMDYKFRMLELVEKYNDIFNDKEKEVPPDAIKISKFFKVLEEFIFSNDEYSMFPQFILPFITSIDRLDCKRQIEIYFMLFMRVLLCQPKNNIKNSNTSYIVAVDNIERLLDDDTDEPIVVQEEDLKICFRAIKKAIENTDSILKAKGDFLINSLIVIFSVRDTTVKLSTTKHDSDNGNEPLDISDWFEAKKIYDNKFAAYLKPEEQCVIKSDYYYKVFDAIISDKKSDSGLGIIISNMYNHNKRRIAEVLREIILTPVNEDVLQEYIKWWEYSHEEGVGQDRGYIRHLCRKAILRLYNNRFEGKGLFKRFGVGGIDGNLEYASYARKVLTFLYRNNKINKRNDWENYVSLNELVKNVLLPANATGYSGINTHEFNHLAKMLFLMTDVNMIPHYWAPLVEINLVGKEKFNESTLYDALRDSEKCPEHEIKITDAGRSYAVLNYDFEYFACRYTKERAPLLFSGIMKKENDIYLCLEIIKNTRNAAISCVKKIIEDDKQTFLHCEGSSNVCEQLELRKLIMVKAPHPVRVVRQHIGYLMHYRLFVNSQSGLDDHNRKEIYDGITKEINEYEKEIRKLLLNDKNSAKKYFNKDYSSFESWVW